jgi:hypothetical protein
VKDKRDELEFIFEQANIETKEERERVKGLEEKVAVAYEKIPKTAQAYKLTVT